MTNKKTDADLCPLVSIAAEYDEDSYKDVKYEMLG